MKSTCFTTLFILAFYFFSFGQSNNDKLLQTMLNDIQKDSLEKTITDLQNFDTRFCFNPNTNKKVALYLQNRYKEIGFSNVEIDSFYLSIDSFWVIPQSSGWQYNLSASIPGVLHPDSICILGAHLDNIALERDPNILLTTVPGADDNASGIAVALEVARLFKKYNVTLKKTIRFEAYDAEEVGLYGSKRLAEKAKENHEKIVFMINNDMVGNNTLPTSEWKVKIQSYNNAPELLLKAEDICKEYTSLQTVLGDSNSRSSDSYSYYQNDFKSIFFMEDNFNPFYHSVNDSVKHLDLNYIAEITKISLAMLFQEATQEVNVGKVDVDSSFSAYLTPNPAKASTSLHIKVPTSTNISICIMNLNGKKVYSSNSFMQSGKHSIELNIQHLISGIYICTIQTSLQTQLLKLIVR